MTRTLLSNEKINPAALSKMKNYHQGIVEEVIAAITNNKIVVIGMDHNPVAKKAIKLLQEKNLSFKYLKFGNYFSKWKERLAIKLWSGWPTYPQIFIDGVLIGGAADLEAYFLSKEKPSV